MSEQQEKKMGHFKKSWLLIKGSWNAFKMDKELTAFPLLSFFTALGLFAIAGFISFMARDAMFEFTSNVGGGDLEIKTAGYIFWVAVMALLGGLSMIFGGAVMHAALERFNGNDPTIKSSLRAALRRGGSLVGFGIFSTLVGYIISEIAERIPFVGGAVIGWLAGSAWNVASFFALPVIVTSDAPVNPVDATKKSVGIIKKVWGESLVVSLSIGIVATIGFLVYSMLFGLIMGFAAASKINGIVVAILAAVGVLGLIVLILIYTVLEAFAKAAIYHYATTGETPASFDERMMRAAFTPKKARKLFSGA